MQEQQSLMMNRHQTYSKVRSKEVSVNLGPLSIKVKNKSRTNLSRKEELQQENLTQVQKNLELQQQSVRFQHNLTGNEPPEERRIKMAYGYKVPPKKINLLA